MLRFLANAPGKRSRALDVQAGEVTLEVGNEAFELETQFGPALLEPGTRVHLRRLDGATRLAVEIGAARLVREGRRLAAGDAVEIGIGSAVVAATSASASSPGAAASVNTLALADAAAPSTPPSASAPVSSAEPESRPNGPDRVDLWATPGDSMVIHDARPPTAIGFPATRCAGLVVLEPGGKGRTTVGTGRVSGSFGRGAHRYRLRCDADRAPFAEGTMTVLSDSGSRRLSTAAPFNRIDTDGRRYTILYQSLLPKLSVRWPNPPAAGPITLVVTSQGKGEKRFSASASYALPPGALTEGSHQLWFEAGVERSRPTTVVIQFDNAAPTASISSPAEGSFAPGASVEVAGTALPGFSVHVGDKLLQQDAQQRFSGQVVAPTDASAIAIRFSHPTRGVHYYLRRSSR